VYWWPVYHALAGAGIGVCVCSAAHMRNVPGRKGDVIDCQWIAELHEHGLLRTGFIPVGAVAGLWARTRYRKKLTGQRTSEGSGWPRCWRRRHQDRPRPPGCCLSPGGR
jgi:transposase